MGLSYGVNCLIKFFLWSVLLLAECTCSLDHHAERKEKQGGPPVLPQQAPDCELQLIAIHERPSEPQRLVLATLNHPKGTRVRLWYVSTRKPVSVSISMWVTQRWVPELSLWEIEIEESQEILDGRIAWYLRDLRNMLFRLFGINPSDAGKPITYRLPVKRHVYFLRKGEVVRVGVWLDETRERCCTLIIMAQELQE
ncbi:hypothetical protein HRbin36_00636 [bacterium HR36]|nr:hypothetical protein HRbin36_00636 [bacterium HR36]